MSSLGSDAAGYLVALEIILKDNSLSKLGG